MPASDVEKPERPGQPLEHRPPGLAAGDDGEAAVLRRGLEGSFREPADRHARAIAHREQAGVAEAADQHRVRPLAVRMRDGPRIERRVLGDRVAGLAGDVRRAEAGGDRVNLKRLAGLRAQMALQQLADRSRGVGVDDEQAGHQRRRVARLRRSAAVPSAIPITAKDTTVVTVPSA